MGVDLKALLAIDPSSAADKICTFIKEQVAEARATGLVIGISGGLDSAVVASLVATAVGPTKVTGLFLPERDTSPESLACARAVARSTGITLQTLDLTNTLEKIGAYRGKVPTAMKSAGINRTAFAAMSRIWGRDPFETTFDANKGNILNEAVAFFRVKHRLRMATLYHRAEREGRLVVGCLNRTECLMGFFVRYGDDAADIAPIIPLYKTQVRTLASYLKVPEAVVGRPPSPDLIAGITDEMAMGITYEVLDQILVGLEHGLEHDEIAKALAVAKSVVDGVAGLVTRAKRLRQEIPAPVL